MKPVDQRGEVRFREIPDKPVDLEPKGFLRAVSLIATTGILLFDANLMAGPEITSQPGNQDVAIGGDAQFMVIATGTGALNYQWAFNGVDLEGWTQSVLKLTNAQPEQAGSYSVAVSDESGSTQSGPALLTVDKEWALFRPANSGLPYKGVVDFEMDVEGNMWLATGRWYANEGGGLARFNGRDWTLWKSGKSPLPANDCTGMTLDAGGNLWISTEAGLAKFDRSTKWTVVWRGQVWYPKVDPHGNCWVGSGGGLLFYNQTNWTRYLRSNSGLPNDFVAFINVDRKGRKWISTYGGLGIFDGTNWITYTKENSGLPHNSVGVIVFDQEETAWITTYGGGLARFDGTNWTAYHTGNSPLPNAYLWDTLIDPKGGKWIGTENGLARFDGTNWSVYKRTNSKLPDNVIYALALDRYENLWVGTRDGGAAVFREGGVILRPRMQRPVADGQGRLLIGWTGGKAKYQLQTCADPAIGGWQNCGAPTDGRSLAVDMNSSSAYFRIQDAQP